MITAPNIEFPPKFSQLNRSRQSAPTTERSDLCDDREWKRRMAAWQSAPAHSDWSICTAVRSMMVLLSAEPAKTWAIGSALFSTQTIRFENISEIPTAFTKMLRCAHANAEAQHDRTQSFRREARRQACLHVEHRLAEAWKRLIDLGERASLTCDSRYRSRPSQSGSSMLGLSSTSEATRALRLHLTASSPTLDGSSTLTLAHADLRSL